MCGLFKISTTTGKYRDLESVSQIRLAEENLGPLLYKLSI